VRGFFYALCPAGITCWHKLFGLNQRCPLSCCGICSGFGQPAPWFGICSGFKLRVSGFGPWCWQKFVRVRGAVFPGSSEKPEHLFANLQLASQQQKQRLTKKKRTIVIFLLYYETFFLYGYEVRTFLERKNSCHI